MLKPLYTNQFEKDLKKQIKSGKNKEKLKQVIINLVNQVELDKKHKDHKLIGKFKDRRECHIEPDWLLIYKISHDEIIFERCGSHSDLFK